jgi:hypothetical protein
MRIREAILALWGAISIMSSAPALAQWGTVNQPPTDQAQVFINGYLQNQTLDLSNMMSLTQPWRQGEVVDSVTIYTRPDQYSFGSRVSLVADGMIVASDGCQSSAIQLRPVRRVELNGWLGQILLQVQGTVYVDQIVMHMHREGGQPPWPGPNPGPIPPPHPQPPPGQGQIVLSATLTNVGSSGRIELTSVLNLNAYRGYRLQALIVRGRSVAGPGRGCASLTINDVPAGEVTFDHIDQMQSFPLRGAWIAGVNVMQMFLQLDGVQARQVQLVLSR